MSYRRSLAGLGLTADERRTRARELYAQGQAHFDAERYPQSLESFQAAYRTLANPVVIVAIARTLESLGRFEDARAKYQEYLWADPHGSAAGSAREGLERTRDRLGLVQRPPGPTKETSGPAEFTSVFHMQVLVAAQLGSHFAQDHIFSELLGANNH